MLKTSVEHTLLGALAMALAACSAADATPPAQGQQGSEETEGMTQEKGAAHSILFETIRGEPLPFSSFDQSVVLVVNTASRCGYTPQYAGLQELHDTFSEAGFTVLGVPSNDFGGQEPGTEEQIVEFCEVNFGVDFPLTTKVHASGPDQHAFWQAAREALGESANPKWNFHKVLVGRDGTFIKAYPSAVRPADAELVADIEQALAQGQS